jgi:hypothetical protein
MGRCCPRFQRGERSIILLLAGVPSGARIASSAGETLRAEAAAATTRVDR